MIVTGDRHSVERRSGRERRRGRERRDPHSPYERMPGRADRRSPWPRRKRDRRRVIVARRPEPGPDR